MTNLLYKNVPGYVLDNHNNKIDIIYDFLLEDDGHITIIEDDAKEEYLNNLYAKNNINKAIYTSFCDLEEQAREWLYRPERYDDNKTIEKYLEIHHITTARQMEWHKFLLEEKINSIHNGWLADLVPGMFAHYRALLEALERKCYRDDPPYAQEE